MFNILIFLDVGMGVAVGAGALVLGGKIYIEIIRKKKQYIYFIH